MYVLGFLILIRTRHDIFVGSKVVVADLFFQEVLGFEITSWVDVGRELTTWARAQAAMQKVSCKNNT